MAKTDFSADKLRKLLDYNPETGVFTNTGVRRNTRAELPGRVHVTNGYVYVSINGSKYFAHRLAWLYVTGQWPDGEIDHINRDRADNRFDNLRISSRSLNNQNKVAHQSNNKLKLIGVSPHRQRFQANIFVGGKRTYLGIFKTEQEASNAYWEAKAKLHPGYVP